MAVPKGKVSKQRRNKRRSAVPITAARSSTLSLWQQASKIPCVLVRREDFHLPSLLFAQFLNKMVAYK